MVPKLKADELMEYINSILIGESPMSHLPEIEAQAQKIENSQYGLAKLLLGMIASLKGDIKELDRHFKAAIMNSGNDPEVRFNYVKALDNANQQLRSIEEMAKLVDDYPDNVEYLQSALKLNVQAFNYDGAAIIFEKIRKLAIEPKISFEDYSALIRNVPHIFESNNVSWKDISHRIEVAGQHLQQIGVLSRRARQYADEDSLFFEFFVLGDKDLATKTESSLQNFLASLPYSPIDEVIAFGCLPA